MSASAALSPTAAAEHDAEPLDLSAFIQDDAEGSATLHLMVEGVHCGGCIQRIERALMAVPGVERARLNLTTRRLVVTWQGGRSLAEQVVGEIVALGYRPVPYDPRQFANRDAVIERHLLRALAVAGFAAGNVMLLSVAVWAGHVQDMGPATRELLHWFAALIALPAIAYAGQPFFTSALRALRHRHTNMDVPIALAILLASGMSLFETTRGGEHVYFDSALMLLFFLLIGRYLDRRARGRARHAAERLLALDGGAVTVLDPNGQRRVLPTSQVEPGMTVLAALGERIGVDGRIVAGTSEVDTSLITGETVPTAVGVGDRVFAGTLNVGAPLKLDVTAIGEGTLLAEIVRLMELAEQRRATYVVLADRIAGWYAPVVHGLALATFLVWFVWLGVAWQVALLYAVAVLIITCPCALGLAVPAVQVIGSGRLLGRGILLKSATALERIAQVDTVVFDKTGTLTEGRPALARPDSIDATVLETAASIAATSRHPLARALARAAPHTEIAENVEEHPGRGLRHGEIRLGNRIWCGVTDEDDRIDGPELWMACPGWPPVQFAFTDPLRADAANVVQALQARGLRIELLSGDRHPAVAKVAAELGIETWRAACTPAEKLNRLEELARAGHRVLMVGDGLNDAAALAAAHVSVSPASAVDISQTAADAVFQGDRLQPVLELLRTAARSGRLIKQNLGLALGYNVITVPLAVMGLVTPLIAALCMSVSSLVVVGNALRFGRGRSA